MTVDCTPKDERRQRVRVRPPRKCDACSGRGWVKGWVSPSTGERRDDWPIACGKCGGRSAFRTMQLARLLGVHRRDVYRVDKLIAGSRVGVRVLDAIAKHFPESLA